MNRTQMNMLGMVFVCLLGLFVHTNQRINFVEQSLDYSAYGPVVRTSIEVEKTRLIEDIIKRSATWAVYVSIIGIFLIFLVRGKE